jgi:tetratricopeptide (TPR) repeat protein
MAGAVSLLTTLHLKNLEGIMAIVVIALKDIMVEPNIPVDLTMLPEEEAIALIKKSYGFLSPEVDVTIKGDIAVINFPEEKAKKVDEALKFYERGVRKAERGEYKAAIELFKKTLDYLPAHSDARRNIAMAYLESGNKEEAKNQLIDVLRLNPKDTWGYVLLGNVYSKYENDFDSAEPFYKKAYELNPDDPYVLTNYATLELERGQTEQARELFLRAIEKDPTYPNARFGLAMLFEKEQKLDQALSSLDQLIAQPVSPDPRSEPVYQHARALYLKICQTMAQRSYALMMELVENARTAVERGGGVPNRDD